MQSFNYKNPTEIILGNGRINEIGSLLRGKVNKLLLVYGAGSVKMNGVYDKVVRSLNENGIEFVEYSGVKPNPVLTHAQKGADFAKAEKVDSILALGGGSVVDESKAIALGACYDGSLWDFFEGKTKPEKSLKLFVILTVPASGSEMNSNSVITNENTNDKWGFRTDLNYPIFSILDPEVTVSLPLEYTALTAVDIITHAIEAYFSKQDKSSYIMDRYVEAIVKSVMQSMDLLIENPRNIDARANLMLAATLAWNESVHCGVGKFTAINHVIQAPMSAIYDITHAAGLSAILPSTMRYFFESYKHKLATFGHNVFEIQETDVDVAANKTIDAFVAWFEKLKVPTSISQCCQNEFDIDLMVNAAMRRLGTGPSVLNEENIKKILEMAM